MKKKLINHGYYKHSASLSASCVDCRNSSHGLEAKKEAITNLTEIVKEYAAIDAEDNDLGASKRRLAKLGEMANRVVNTHDELLEAAEKALSGYTALINGEEVSRTYFKARHLELSKAIAKAKGGK